uniref:Uncharacterized protein n=1 Tax=Anguilla anguilla TaxID=7936 RepID=A0A0E9WRZ9_ANGAN
MVGGIPSVFSQTGRFNTVLRNIRSLIPTFNFTSTVLNKEIRNNVFY